MKLPDFLDFAAFNALREQMGAEQLGAFEFFDPRLHLTAAEREQLAHGFVVGWARLRRLHDYTLAYKNSRILLWFDRTQAPEAYNLQAAPCYHLAYCRRLQALRQAEPEGRVRIASALPAPDPWPWRVCSDCLQQIQFRGFDAARGRHRDYSERVLETFELDDFFNQYPIYPITSDVLRALDAVA